MNHKTSISHLARYLLIVLILILLATLWNSGLSLMNFSLTIVSLAIGLCIASIFRQPKNEVKAKNLPKSSHSSLSADQILSSVEVGYISFSEDMRISESNLSTIRGIQLIENSQDVMSSFFKMCELDSEQLSSTQFNLSTTFGMSELQWKLNSQNLITETIFKADNDHISLRLKYIPTIEEEKVVKISIVIQDISEHKKYEKEASKREQEIEKIFALLQVSDSLFELFMDETRTLFDDIKCNLKLLRNAEDEMINELTNQMFRSVHTIKANSKLFKLHAIQNVAHEVEQYLADIRDLKIQFDVNSLETLTKKIMSISEEIYSYASLRKEILSSFEQKKDQSIKYRVQWIRSLLSQFTYVLRDPQFEIRHLRSVHREISRALATFDRISIRDYLPGYEKMIQEISGQLGKKIAPLKTHLEYHYFDPNTLTLINDIIIHSIRNSLDHGIELPEEREAKGKSAAGMISIQIRESNEIVHIEIEDDGKGIDTDKIHQKAIERGLLAANKNISEGEALKLVFHPGFSTADQVSTISGRGLGMDAVSDIVQRMKGNIEIDSSSGKYTKIKIDLPMKSEELLTPFFIYDFTHVSKEIIQDYQKITDQDISIDLDIQPAFVFGDRWSMADNLRSILAEAIQQSAKSSQIHLSIEKHQGRRKIDSYWFHRLNIENLQAGFKYQETAKIKSSRKILEDCSGSLILKENGSIEVNVPSNIPVPFSSFVFQILLFTHNPQAQQQVEHFFIEYMGGWAHQCHLVDSDTILDSKELNTACLVIADDDLIKNYYEKRTANLRMQDYTLLLTELQFDMSKLIEYEIPQDKVIFMSKDYQSSSIERALAELVLKKFLSDMIRNKKEESQHSIQLEA